LDQLDQVRRVYPRCPGNGLGIINSGIISSGVITSKGKTYGQQFEADSEQAQ
jgi:hypothetical protein